MRLLLLGLLTSGALLVGCGDSTTSTSTSGGAAAAAPSTGAGPAGSGDTPASGGAASGGAPGGSKYPDIKKAVLKPAGSGAYTLSVTVSSPYDSPKRYADGWRVLQAGTDKVLGMHTLGHDHASEQPFTREQSDLQVPAGVKQITIEGRDQKNGFGGKTVTIDVPN